MIVVLTISKRFQVVTTVEEFRDISTTATLNDKFTTRMVGSIVCSVKNEIIEKAEVAFAASSNGIELLFGDSGQGLNKLNVLSHVDLVVDL